MKSLIEKLRNPAWLLEKLRSAALALASWIYAFIARGLRYPIFFVLASAFVIYTILTDFRGIVSWVLGVGGQIDGMPAGAWLSWYASGGATLLITGFVAYVFFVCTIVTTAFLVLTIRREQSNEISANPVARAILSGLLIVGHLLFAGYIFG